MILLLIFYENLLFVDKLFILYNNYLECYNNIYSFLSISFITLAVSSSYSSIYVSILY